MIDEAAPHFKGNDGDPLFAESGEPNAALIQQLTFLKACSVAEAETSAWVARMESLGLLVERDINVRSPQGKRYLLQGFHVFDAARISLLHDFVVANLARDGSLALIYAHLMSLEHLTTLSVRRDRATKAVGKKKDVQSDVFEKRDLFSAGAVESPTVKDDDVVAVNRVIKH